MATGFGLVLAKDFVDELVWAMEILHVASQAAFCDLVLVNVFSEPNAFLVMANVCVLICCPDVLATLRVSSSVSAIHRAFSSALAMANDDEPATCSLICFCERLALVSATSASQLSLELVSGLFALAWIGFSLCDFLHRDVWNVLDSSRTSDASQVMIGCWIYLVASHFCFPIDALSQPCLATSHVCRIFLAIDFFLSVSHLDEVLAYRSDPYP